ncbi:MAG: bifunctional (p)ppGpp synthetase/guanosine-3',5'-bis(diphosphate) 3'-pyrophosphohydrolase [Calditrichaeota bacterium]|nr:MAG: bifunctional (p)ppGpp synthetase/guanosine-3',5'-bis(diphosphate) 3'-pyrophosphohydrolase [Calditrichota bacterium]
MAKEILDINLLNSKFDELLRLLKNISENDKKLISKAYKLALENYSSIEESQIISNSIELSKIAYQLFGLGTSSIISIFLFNAVKDEKLKLSKIQKNFTQSAAKITDGLVKLANIDRRFLSSQTKSHSSSIQIENYIKLLFSLTQDARCILLRIAFRLFVMRNLKKFSTKDRKEIALETSLTHVPIAHRLGLYEVKSELEELAMKFAYSERYKEISKKLKATKKDRENYIKSFVSPLKKRLSTAGLNFQIKWRTKSIHSIWNKMLKQNVPFESVYDIFAVRIILDCEKESEKSSCWQVYSMITEDYQPDPNRLRDWISAPKESGYESLHTTVRGPENKWIEIQIRTKRMDEIAEKGNAAHWRYKESSKTSENIDEWLVNIREVLETKSQNIYQEFEQREVKFDSDEIFIFTPTNDIMRLRAGSTVLDFAYSIHTGIGSTCTGAKIDNKNYPLNYVLSTGQKVEIKTSKNQKPRVEWLNFVISSKAKTRIKSTLNAEKFKNSELGKEKLRRKFKQLKIPFETDQIDKLLTHYGCKLQNELFHGFGTDKFDISNVKTIFEEISSPNKVEEKIHLEASTENKVIAPKNEELLILDKGLSGIDSRLAKCCNPIWGDPVFGFVTVSKGVKIHKRNCPNSKDLFQNHSHRIIKAKWNETSDEAGSTNFVANIRVVGKDSFGIVASISDLISNKLGLYMHSVEVKSKPDGTFIGDIGVQVTGKQQLEMVIRKLNTIKGIQYVHRVSA